MTGEVEPRSMLICCSHQNLHAAENISLLYMICSAILYGYRSEKRMAVKLKVLISMIYGLVDVTLTQFNVTS